VVCLNFTANKDFFLWKKIKQLFSWATFLREKKWLSKRYFLEPHLTYN
jgi:hypothetical protein